jgi:hypothetical protein
MRTLILIVVLLIARPVSAQELSRTDKFFHVGVGAFLGLVAIDDYTTISCLKEFPSVCREGNWFISEDAKRNGGITQALIKKSAINGGILAAIALVRWKKPSWNLFLTESVWTMNGVQVAVDISNWHTLQTLRTGAK